MVNTQKLEQKIIMAGLKKKYLAEKTNMSYPTFYNCITNKSCFRISHVEILCKELGITDLKEKEAIFFAKVGG